MHKTNTTTVRFNLSAGENYLKWKITYPSGEFIYLELETPLTMVNVLLRNQPATANKIFEGANKSVCAWVECDEVIIGEALTTKEPLRYNPRVHPHWHIGNVTPRGSLDNSSHPAVTAINGGLYLCDPPETCCECGGLFDVVDGDMHGNGVSI